VELLCIVAILLLAAVLRLYRLGDELWFDEVVTHVRVASLDLWSIATTYESQNQHLLYSLLARGALVAFGDTPAALRAPAAVFGVLSIGAMWLLGRELLSRRQALLAAALLALSDVHVWFSQNARGYSALLAFTLLASWLLLHALRDDRRRTWIAYGVVSALGIWIHLTMLFVVVAHALSIARRRLPGPSAARAARLAGPLLGISVAGMLSLLAYAPILPAVLSVNATEGRGGGIPEWSSSRWALAEVVERVRASFAHPWLALAALVFGGIGAVRALRRQPLLLELLVLPVVVALLVVVGSGHHVWPRLLFFAAGFAALLVVAGASALGETLARRLGTDARTSLRAGTALCVVLIVATALALPGAYGAKQRFVEAAALVDSSVRPGEIVLTAGPAAFVVEHELGRAWPKVATAAELDAASRGASGVWLVHTFPIHLRARRPEIARALDERFVEVARLGGTLHGGEVVVWRSRAPGDFAGAPR
jgi:mannosyltransferase